MNEIIEGLEEILEKIKEKAEKEVKKQERVADYCIVCEIFLDDPTRFTCGNPQCNKELLNYKKPAATLTKSLLDDLGADSIEEARKKVEKMRDLIKEISQKLEGRKSGG